MLLQLPLKYLSRVKAPTRCLPMAQTAGHLRGPMTLVLLDLPRIEPKEGLARDLREGIGSTVILLVVVMIGALETLGVILHRVIATMIVTAVVSTGNALLQDVRVTALGGMKCLRSSSKSG